MVCAFFQRYFSYTRPLANIRKKSLMTIKHLDIFRNIVAIPFTIFVIYNIWEWSWILAILGAVPIYFLAILCLGLPILLIEPSGEDLKLSVLSSAKVNLLKLTIFIKQIIRCATFSKSICDTNTFKFD